MITLSDYWVTFLLGTALPALVALVTTRFTSSTTKSLLLLLLSAVTGVLTSVQVDGGVLEWRSALSSFFIAFITAVVTHFGLLKPTGVTGSGGALESVSLTRKKQPRHRG